LSIILIGKEITPCLACANGYYTECLHPLDDDIPCGLVLSVEITLKENDTSAKLRGGQVKDAADITDVQSTGRKRAADMYPISEGMNCEWQGLAFAGGGVVTSIGCINNLATAIHHGPDKNTLNNNPENVHRICAKCHNWWHAQNDEFYGSRPSGTEPFIPLDTHKWSAHNPTEKTDLETLVKEQLRRGIRKDRRTTIS
jgi:hypothetical protein